MGSYAHLLMASEDAPAHVANESTLSLLTVLSLVIVAIGHVVVSPIVSHVCRSSASSNGFGRVAGWRVSKLERKLVLQVLVGEDQSRVPHFVIVPQIDRGFDSCKQGIFTSHTAMTHRESGLVDSKKGPAAKLLVQHEHCVSSAAKADVKLHGPL